PPPQTIPAVLPRASLARSVRHTAVPSVIPISCHPLAQYLCPLLVLSTSSSGSYHWLAGWLTLLFPRYESSANSRRHSSPPNSPAVHLFSCFIDLSLPPPHSV